MKYIKLLFLFACLASAVFADMTVVQTLKSDLTPGQDQKNATMTMTVKGQKARIDLPASQMSSIIDLKEGKMYTLMHQQKQIMVISLDELKKAADMSAQTQAGSTKPSVTKTGKAETIKGYRCSQYEITGTGQNPATMRCWITEDVSDAEMEPFRSFGGRMGGFLGFDAAQKPKGMIIRSESKINIAGRDIASKSEVQSIKREPVADSVFTIPADYQMMELPAFTPPPQPAATK